LENARLYSELKQVETDVREILHLVPHQIGVVSADGARLYSNQAVLDYYALPSEELQGSAIDTGEMVRRFAHPDDAEKFSAARERGFGSTAPWETEARFRRWDGDYRWFLVRFTPLRDDDGRVVRWYSTATDIDDRKRAEDTVRRQ